MEMNIHHLFWRASSNMALIAVITSQQGQGEEGSYLFVRKEDFWIALVHVFQAIAGGR